jgi:hypothetical protein
MSCRKPLPRLRSAAVRTAASSFRGFSGTVCRADIITAFFYVNIQIGKAFLRSVLVWSVCCFKRNTQFHGPFITETSVKCQACINLPQLALTFAIQEANSLPVDRDFAQFFTGKEEI